MKEVFNIEGGKGFRKNLAVRLFIIGLFIIEKNLKISYATLLEWEIS